MNKIKINFIIFGLIWIITCYGNVFSQNLSLRLNLDSKTFIESQDILVTVSVVNNSSDTQRVMRETLNNTHGGLRFTLHDSRGNKIPSSGDVTGGDWDEISIPPYDSITQLYNILGEFNTSGNDGAPCYLPSVHYLRAGWYSLDGKTFTGKETLRAETVRFEVKQPSIEEAEVLILLKSADSLYGINDKKSIEKYESILERYPRSVYIPYLYSRMIFIYSVVKVDKSHTLRLVEQFANHHPNNNGALREVRSKMPEFIRLNRKGIIESLARDHPNTRVGKYCKQKLEELKIIKGE
jgi:hypothetical protein